MTNRLVVLAPTPRPQIDATCPAQCRREVITLEPDVSLHPRLSYRSSVGHFRRRPRACHRQRWFGRLPVPTTIQPPQLIIHVALHPTWFLLHRPQGTGHVLYSRPLPGGSRPARPGCWHRHAHRLVCRLFDYPWRILCPAAYLPRFSALTASIDYGNFKCAIAASPTQRPKLSAYHDIHHLDAVEWQQKHDPT